jgi:hypothetical protein
VNKVKAMPHFFVDNKAGIEMAQSAISIQLLKSATSPFTISKTMNRMFIIIHAAIAYSVTSRFVLV